MFRTVLAAGTLTLALAGAAIPAAAMQTPQPATPAAGMAIWLDEASPSWNAPGMAIPTAPDVGAPDAFLEERCAAQVREPETAEDRQLADAGWRLFGGYQAGWGLTVVDAFVGFDGMCRPTPYQVFVFDHGAFAGTLAPEPMFPRTDGALSDAHLFRGEISAEYERYAPTDPLCCPSGSAVVRFAVTDGVVTVASVERGS